MGKRDPSNELIAILLKFAIAGAIFYYFATGLRNATENIAVGGAQRNEATRLKVEAAQAERKAAELQKTKRAEEARQLQPGERCINKQRFRRLENGWEQIGSC